MHKEPLAGQRLCVIGDGGWGNAPSLAVGQALVELNCDQIRYLGDLVYPDGITGPEDPLLESRFFAPLGPALDAGIPVYLYWAIMTGNRMPRPGWRWPGNTR